MMKLEKIVNRSGLLAKEENVQQLIAEIKEEIEQDSACKKEFYDWWFSSKYGDNVVDVNVYYDEDEDETLSFVLYELVKDDLGFWSVNTDKVLGRAEMNAKDVAELFGAEVAQCVSLK